MLIDVEHFENIFSPICQLSGKGFSTTSYNRGVALHRGEYVAAILMDLSKVFDFLPPNKKKKNNKN